jgi:hypothetical protein
MRDQITYHCEEKIKLQTEIIALRTRLDGAQSHGENLAVECAQLRSGSSAAGCLTLLGTVIAVVGGAVLSYAGADPTLSEKDRMVYCSGGSAATACGILILLAAYLLTAA